MRTRENRNGQMRACRSILHPLLDIKMLRSDDMEAAMDRSVDAMEACTPAAEECPRWIKVPSKVGQMARARTVQSANGVDEQLDAESFVGP